MNGEAHDTIPRRPQDCRPLSVGDQIPAVTLPNSEGGEWEMRAAAARNRLILVFHRGGW